MSHPLSARPALPVSAPVRVRDLLRTAPDGPVPVVHRGPQALYVALGGRCIGLLAASAARVPCGLRSRLGHFSPDEGLSAYLDKEGVLHIDSRPLSVGRVVEVHVPRFDRGELLRNTADSITCTATPPAAVVEFVVSAASAGITVDAVRRLLGRGEGLTPLGDDVLCGWLATHRAYAVATPEVDAAVRAGLGRTTLLSATLLECALEGEVLPELGDWLSAVGTPDLARRSRRADALLAVGASSGAGLMAGALLALDALAAQEIAA